MWRQDPYNSSQDKHQRNWDESHNAGTKRTIEVSWKANAKNRNRLHPFVTTRQPAEAVLDAHRLAAGERRSAVYPHALFFAPVLQ